MLLFTIYGANTDENCYKEDDNNDDSEMMRKKI